MLYNNNSTMKYKNAISHSCDSSDQTNGHHYIYVCQNFNQSIVRLYKKIAFLIFDVWDGLPWSANKTDDKTTFKQPC